MFAGAFPVFVAATISRAVVAIIEAITENIDVQIGLSLVYALVFAQTIGYAVIFSVPSSSPLFRYYFRIATENTAFAWKETMVLILVNKLIFEDPIVYSFVAYFAIAASAFLLIAASNAIHMFALKTKEDIYMKIKLFESEIFSLGLAYCFNLVVIAWFCGTNYLSVLDYAESEGDDVDDGASNQCSNLGFFYAVGLTYLLMQVQNSGIFSTAEEMLEDAEQCLEAEEEAEVERLEAEKEQEEAEGAAAGVEDVEAAVAHRPINSDAASSSTGAQDVEAVGEKLFSVAECCVDCAVVLTRVCTPADALLCSWDEKRSTNASLGMLLFTFLGFYVGCGWYTYSLGVFGFLEGEMPPVVGSLVFALVVTTLGLHYLVVATTALEYDQRMAKKKVVTKIRMRKVQIMVTAIR
jgi:hypothetical protein